MKMSMKTAGFAALFVSLSFCAISAHARNEAYFLPIQAALEMGEGKEKLGNDIKFYFGDQPHPAVEATLAHNVVAHKKGSITARTDEEACNRSMLATLLYLQARARKIGANAVINIESYYKNNSFRSNDQFECRAGSAKTIVFLKGDIVRLKKE